MYQTKAERDKYYNDKLSPLKYEYRRTIARTLIDLQDESIKGLMIAEYHEYDQDVLDKLYRKYLREADFTGVLHPQFGQWLDEIRQESTDNLENDALADAILQKSEENQGKIELKS